MNPSSTECVQLFQIKDDKVYYNLKVKHDFSWLLYCCGQKVIKAYTHYSHYHNILLLHDQGGVKGTPFFAQAYNE